MEITYRTSKEFEPAILQSLFESVQWESSKFPNRLTLAMKNSSMVISAWHDEQLIGLVRSLDDGATIAFIHYLLVRPEYQKFHIGSELMKRLMSQYKDYLYIKIIPSDPATIPFYKKFGFVSYDNYSAMIVKKFDDAKDIKI